MEKQRWEESEKRREKREDQRRERVRRKKMQAREKAEKSRFIVFFQWFVAPEGAKAAGAEPAGPKRNEKLHAVVARSTFASEKLKTPHVRSTFGSCDVEKCAPLLRKAHVQVKMYKAHQRRSTFGSWDVEKVHAVVVRSPFPGQHLKNITCSDHFWRFRCGFAWQAQGILHLAKMWGACSVSTNDGRRGTFEEDLDRCISRGRRSTRDTCIRDIRRSGRWFPERGCILEHQIFRFAKLILRDRRCTSYCLASLLRGCHLTQMEWKNRKTHWYEAVSSALNFPFFEGCLAELLCFWCSQLRKLRKSRRIVSVLMLLSSKVEEVSQNCFVLKLADRQVDR